MEPNDNDARQFVESVPGQVRRRDAGTLLEMFERITGEPPRMWGPSIIGFGEYHYEYASGRSGDAGAAGFSPRKASSTVYLPDGVAEYTDELARLGDHSTGLVCLYLKNLDAVDLEVLESIVRRSYERVSAPGFGQYSADAPAD